MLSVADEYLVEHNPGAPRPLAEIDAELKVVADPIVAMIGELSK